MTPIGITRNAAVAPSINNDELIGVTFRADWDEDEEVSVMIEGGWDEGSVKQPLQPHISII